MALSKNDLEQMSPWQRNVAGLLTLAFGVDGRELTAQTVISWAEVLGDEKRLTPQDCYQAIKDHYRNESRRMMPVDLLGRAKKFRLERRQTGIELESGRAAPMPPEVRQMLDGLKTPE